MSAHRGIPGAEPVLRLQGISKRFGPLIANDGISLTLGRGEVLALLGENGAGKSTLMSILFGHYRADAGRIEVFGQPLAPGNPKAALAAGIGMVHQHFTLADNLCVLDNVMLGSEALWQPFTRRAAARDKLRDVAQRFGLDIDADAIVGSLSVGQRQRVEILKALYRGARILILDEPTAVLTPQEGEALFDTLGQMVAEGLSIVFISHKLAEVLRVSHRIAVLRHGRLVAELPAADATQSTLAKAMVGHDVATPTRRQDSSSGASAREVTMASATTSSEATSHLVAADAAPAIAVFTAAAPVTSATPVCLLENVFTSGIRDALRGVSLRIAAGEIVAVAGISGNGQTALAELLCGTRKASAGRVELDGARLRPKPSWLVQRGVARIPEDRQAVGLIGELPLWENAVSERLRGRAFRRGPWVRSVAARRHAMRIVTAFDVRGGNLDQPVRALSGGNMQKLILGRALLAPESAAKAAPAVPRLIVAHQPTWGLDIGAVAYVHQELLAVRDAGAAVLLISDDLDEVMLLGDRIAVLHAGRLADARGATHWTRETIGLAMAGGEVANVPNVPDVSNVPNAPPRRSAPHETPEP
ncbi:MAG: ABC transporter ATP-binding protein [Variovorax sp.]